MKVAVNTRFLLKDRLEGIGWFAHETLKRLVENHPDVEFHFLFDRPFDPSFIYGKNVVPHVLFPQARHPLLWYWWFEWSVTKTLKKIKPDVFYSPDGYCSLRTAVPTVLTIHDLAFEHHPEDVKGLVSKYYRYFTPKFARKAKKILTVSEYSKQDIHQQYNIDLEKIDVVYNGCNSLYRPLLENERKDVRAKYTGGKPYFLFIGALHPRKNIKRLFQAFDQFKKSTRAPHLLMIVGRKGWSTADIEETYKAMEFRSDVIMTGRLASEEIAKVLGAAFALTYVPYFEGFGIPIIEAQNTGVPVVTSNMTSMPEVVGEGGVMIDPFNEEDITRAMIQLVKNPDLYLSLREKGAHNAERFSWDKTAKKIWENIEELFENR